MAHFVSIQAAIALLACGTLLLYSSRFVRAGANSILSSVINRYLLWRYPIRHIDGDKVLPTCPYRFPNGQGDVGKFLDGMKNSKAWEKQHGGIYRIWSGTQGEVVLTRPEHIQVVFKDSDRHCKAVDNNSGYLMSQVLGKCVGLISGEEWKTVRISLEQPFLRSRAVDYVPMIHRQIVRHLDELRLTRSLGQGLLDPAEDLKLLPFWIVAEIIYGALSPEMIAELRDLAATREELFKHVIRGGVSRFAASKFLPTKANGLLREFQRRWTAFNDAACRNAKSPSSSSSSSSRAAGEAPIVRLYDLVAGGTITKTQLLQTLDESLYANLDVTTGGISWNLVFLAAYPDYQDRLRREAAAAGEDWEHHVRSSTTLLAACVSESSRLKPLAAFSVPQSAPTTRIVGGYAIPPGTNFIVDSCALNIRNEFWGDDATAYRPERFLEQRGTGMRYHFWRFGFGPRQCMGKYVADLMIRTLLLHLVGEYELGLLQQAEGEWGRNPESWINHPKMQIRCVKRGEK